MQRHNWFHSEAILFAVVSLSLAGACYAEGLCKYIDKDGKVTYSDKAPKKGENAQPVTSDSSTNVIDAPKNTKQGVPQKLQDVKGRADERERLRDKLKDALQAAKDDLADAKAVLESGREPQPGETQIIVGRTKTGAPTGTNTQMRKPEYYARIASLEDAVKKAEARLEIAERNYRTDAP